MDHSVGDDQPVRILHVLRAPIGGLWRHVVDLTREQVERGHAVGIVADSLTGGERAEQSLRDLAPHLALGVSRVPMRRNPHPSDLLAFGHVTSRILRGKPDVVHGHGSKGGLLARLAAPTLPSARLVRAYTPHGGSLNYRPGSRLHALYMRAEAVLQRRTDLILFESGFIASRYATFVGQMPRVHRVVHNGIRAEEFVPVEPTGDATDFLYVGELRAAKGIDTLLAAMVRVGQFFGTPPTLTLVGSGPDRAALEAQAAATGLTGRVFFHDPMPARQAFALGKVLVVPSRAESLPYIVLEAAGASIPMVATDVGGIPEIFGPMRRRLIPADNVFQLGDQLIDTLKMTPDRRQAEAQSLFEYVRAQFSMARMVDGVLSGYRDARVSQNSQKMIVTPVSSALAQ